MTSATANKLTVIQAANGTGGALSRRQMVRRLLAGISAGAIWPLAAASHPIFAHFTDDGILEEAEKLAAANWKPVFLNAQQNESLIAIAEAIVPGSTKAEVNRFIDLLLSVDKLDNQHRFAESLTAFEAETQGRFANKFSSLDDRQKNIVLSDASKNSPDSDAGQKSEAKETKSGLHAHFENLKGWVSGAYYSSEMGMRELGWTGDYVFEKFPGCEHPEGHD
jgi:hypothetical protein